MGLTSALPKLIMTARLLIDTVCGNRLPQRFLPSARIGNPTDTGYFFFSS